MIIRVRFSLSFVSFWLTHFNSQLAMHSFCASSDLLFQWIQLNKQNTTKSECKTQKTNTEVEETNKKIHNFSYGKFSPIIFFSLVLVVSQLCACYSCIDRMQCYTERSVMLSLDLYSCVHTDCVCVCEWRISHLGMEKITHASDFWATVFGGEPRQWLREEGRETASDWWSQVKWMNHSEWSKIVSECVCKIQA